uniref:Uncharacterized protein n=1 Tax=Arundo donax TaxID=35708 RepID=A0A0A9A7J6_ARUDO
MEEAAGEEKLSVSSDPVRTGPWHRRSHEGTFAAVAMTMSVPPYVSSLSQPRPPSGMTTGCSPKTAAREGCPALQLV